MSIWNIGCDSDEIDENYVSDQLEISNSAIYDASADEEEDVDELRSSDLPDVSNDTNIDTGAKEVEDDLLKSEID
jgi:hypothetical protein